MGDNLKIMDENNDIYWIFVLNIKVLLPVP